jgi:hypothetical protein
MKTYIVTVKVQTIELYEVEAETPDEAIELWQDGKLLQQDLMRLESEPVRVEEKGGRPMPA